MSSDNLVICPVYNEGNTINEFYRKLRQYYYKDVLFVDDGSNDPSEHFLRRIKDSYTFLVRHGERQGYGASLISGFDFALHGPYKRIVTIDADLQHNPEDTPSFFRELLEYEVVLGSRYIRIDKYFKVPKERMTINRYIASIFKLLFDTEFTDPFCGFRGYRSSFLKKAHFGEKSYGAGVEVLMEIIRTGASFEEIPVEAIYLDKVRGFLDGLNDPRARLLHYLETIARKRRDMQSEKKIFSCKPASR